MKKKAILNFSASIIYQFMNLLVGLVVPKFYTELFGSVYNGLNQSVTQIMSLLSVLQFGIAAAAIQQMFKYIAENDEDSIRAIYWGTGKEYRKMGYVFVGIILPIIVVFPFMIKDNLSYWTVIAFLLFRTISAAMEYFFQAKYGVILIANNKTYAVYIVNIIILLIGTALHLFVLFTIKNIIVYQFVSVLTTFIRFIIVNAYIRKHFPYLYKRNEKEVSLPKDTRRKDVLMSEIAGLVIDSTDMLLLSWFSGLVYTSIYSVYNFVVLGLANVLNSCREAVFAGLGKSYFSDFDEFKKHFSNFESVYLFLAFFLYSTALMLFRPFIEVYTKNMDANYVYISLPILFIVGKLLVNLRIPSIVSINTAGHFKEVRNYAIIEAIIKFSLSIILVKPLGIFGVLIGTIAGALYRTPILIQYSNKNIIKRKGMEYWKKVIMWMPFFAVVCIISVVAPIRCTSLITWVITAIPVAVVMLISCLLWIFLFERNTFNEMLNIIKKMLKKGK
jgi:O-antigen/teichoic acid export membrane protein